MHDVEDKVVGKSVRVHVDQPGNHYPRRFEKVGYSTPYHARSI